MDAEVPTETAKAPSAKQMEVEAAAGTASGPAELADAETSVGIADCTEEQIKSPISMLLPDVTHTAALQSFMRRSTSQTPARYVHLPHNRSLVSIAYS